MANPPGSSNLQVTTVFLRQPAAQFFLEARRPYLHGDGFVDLVIEAIGLLFRAAFPDKLLGAAVFLHQLILVLVYVIDDGFKFRTRQAWHDALDKVEIVPAVKVVKNIQHGQAVALDLRAPAEVDNLDRFGLHRITSKQYGYSIKVCRKLDIQLRACHFRFCVRTQARNERSSPKAVLSDVYGTVRQINDVLLNGGQQLVIFHVPDRFVGRADGKVGQIGDQLAETHIGGQFAQARQKLQDFLALRCNHGSKSPIVGNGPTGAARSPTTSA